MARENLNPFLERAMKPAYAEVRQTARRRKVSPRQGAMVLAVQRVADP